MTRRVLILCNALDDAVRRQRGITTDSPAASRKVFAMANAVRRAGLRPVVISYARGRQDGTGRYFSARVCRVGRVPVVYLPFWNVPLGSELLSMVAPVAWLWRWRANVDSTALVFYNRLALHLPALLAGATLRFIRILDLEDGEAAVARTRSLARRAVTLYTRMFDRMCSGGALLACSALAEATSVRPVLCYYGVVVPSTRPRPPAMHPLRVLLGGTLAEATGAPLLSAAVAVLRARGDGASRQLVFEISGKGPSLPLFEALSASEIGPAVQVHGRLSDEEYDRLVADCHVGLALKPRGGPLAQTTFPSKVVEMAGAGLAVVTTDISDVRIVLGEGAFYLSDESADGLADLLSSLCANLEAVDHVARVGRHAVQATCDPDYAGRRLAAFCFPGHS